MHGLGHGQQRSGTGRQARDPGQARDPRQERLAGRVVAVMRQRAMVEVSVGGRRRLCELGRADVDFARLIPDMRRWFAPGDKLSGTMVADAAGSRHYTLLAGRQNPWPVLTAWFPAGATLTSQVVSVRDGVGAFVAVADGINGRVPSAETRRARLAPGQWVEVNVTGVDPALRRIGLRLRRVLPGRGQNG